VFHQSQVDIRKWFLLIAMAVDSRKPPTSRLMAKMIHVNKNTANYMLMRLKCKGPADFNLLLKIRDEVMNGNDGQGI
jgi:hypothetical protein